MPTLQQYLNDRGTYPDTQKITLADGVETTLGELRGGYLMQADYTRKTTELSNYRRQLDQEKTEWDAARLEAEARLTELAKTLMATNPGMTREEAEDEIEADPRNKKLLSKLEQLEAKLAAYDEKLPAIERGLRGAQEAYVADKHRQALAEIKKQDPDVDVDELVNYARTHYIGRLDDAYRSYRHEALVDKAVKRATEEARKEAYEKAKQDLLQPLITPRRVVTPGPDAPKDFDGARDAALSDPEILKIMSEGSGLLT